MAAPFAKSAAQLDDLIAKATARAAGGAAKGDGKGKKAEGKKPEGKGKGAAVAAEPKVAAPKPPSRVWENVVARFAPSPTGYLHIGGARTALYNFLFARRYGGKFLIRIEDTDRERSTQGAVDAIFESLKWLELSPDEEPVFQFARMHRHAEVALDLLAKGRAYKCFATAEELDEMREEQKRNKLPPRYDGRWRERDPATAPPGAKYVVRLKVPQEGETTVNDLVMGDVTVQNKQNDDMVLLRSDGTPTYMLSVVVDDHDMGVTHVIRGADHLTNTFRQVQLYQACDWSTPHFSHIPLIHGPDGKKLSKRHGATGAEQYKEMGYLPAAIRNYLLRLGWAHGDTELITTEEAIRIFDLNDLNRSPANFDFAKLDDINAHYMRGLPDNELYEFSLPFIQKKYGDEVTSHGLARVMAALAHLKVRAKTLDQMATVSGFLIKEVALEFDDGAKTALKKDGALLLPKVLALLSAAPEWDLHVLEKLIRDHAIQEDNMKMARLTAPIRAAITGSNASPPLFDMMIVLGKALSLARIEAAIKKSAELA